MYYKFKNSYDPKHGTWWMYARVIKDNKDGLTCQLFRFEQTSRDHHFRAGIDRDFNGDLDTNKYFYYEDLWHFEKCSKEEFERELKIFMEDLNNFVSFLNYSP